MTLDQHPTAESLADVAEVLMREYGERLSPATVSDAVLAAHRDLVGQIPDHAHAELLYRLARQRLGPEPDQDRCSDN